MTRQEGQGGQGGQSSKSRINMSFKSSHLNPLKLKKKSKHFVKVPKNIYIFLI